MHMSWVPTCPAGHPCRDQYSGAQKQFCPPGVNIQGIKMRCGQAERGHDSHSSPWLEDSHQNHLGTRDRPLNLGWGLEYTDLTSALGVTDAGGIQVTSASALSSTPDTFWGPRAAPAPCSTVSCPPCGSAQPGQPGAGTCPL